MERNFTVTIKETGEGKPWLLVELHEDIGLAPDNHISINLPPGTTIAKAQEIARVLNQEIQTFSIARF